MDRAALATSIATDLTDRVSVEAMVCPGRGLELGGVDILGEQRVRRVRQGASNTSPRSEWATLMDFNVKSVYLNLPGSRYDVC